MGKEIASEGKEILGVLSIFPEFQDISQTPIGELNAAINCALRQLASRSDSESQEALRKIRNLHEKKILREANERGAFIGPNPFCD